MVFLLVSWWVLLSQIYILIIWGTHKFYSTKSHLSFYTIYSINAVYTEGNPNTRNAYWVSDRYIECESGGMGRGRKSGHFVHHFHLGKARGKGISILFIWNMNTILDRLFRIAGYYFLKDYSHRKYKNSNIPLNSSSWRGMREPHRILENHPGNLWGQNYVTQNIKLLFVFQSLIPLWGF